MSDKKFLVDAFLDGEITFEEGMVMADNRVLTEEEKEIVNNFKDLLESDKEAFLRSAYMTGLYMHLEKLQWAIMKDTEWHGGKRAIAYIKIQNMMNTAHSMIAPEYEYLLEDALNEWTIERRKREEI